MYHSLYTLLEADGQATGAGGSRKRSTEQRAQGSKENKGIYFLIIVAG
jgi:hypothetical protein